MIRKSILLLVWLSLFGATLFSPSCANTTAPPSGGRKDTIPPVLIRTNPPENSVNFKGKSIELRFDEFPKIVDAVNQIYLSPPQSKRPTARVKGKSVVITFSEPLDTTTTYSLQMGESIVDNNEGNPFGSYSFSFSTGSELDSLFFSGYVVDAQTLLPMENISVLLHTNESDTAIYKTLPRAMAKTDLWGYFSVLNLKGIPYHIFAIEDLNRNNRYEDNNERIAFIDSLFIPHKDLFSDSLAARRINPKDTLLMLSRPVDHTLYLFKESPKRQILREKVRPQPRYFYFTFGAPNAQIDSIEIEGINPQMLIREHSFFKDTIRYWVQGDHIPDTLTGLIRYFRTDSLNQLSPFEEKFALTIPKEQEPIRDSVSNVNVLKVDISSNSEFVEQNGVLFSFSAYPIELESEKIVFTYTTPREEEIAVPFSFQKDSLNGSMYRLIPEKWTPSMSYKVVAPANIFTDVYGYVNDSLYHTFTLPDVEKTGSISLTLKGGNGWYLVELLTSTREKVIRSLHIPAGGNGLFSYLPDDIYIIRITEDKNGNGVWDTGSYDHHIPPERVRFYTFADGSDLIEINEKLELNQTIDIEELFSHDVTPIVPTKTNTNTNIRR